MSEKLRVEIVGGQYVLGSILASISFWLFVLVAAAKALIEVLQQIAEKMP